MVDIFIPNGGYKPTYNWGAPPCSNFNNDLVGGLEHEFYDFPISWECHHPN